MQEFRRSNHQRTIAQNGRLLCVMRVASTSHLQQKKIKGYYFLKVQSHNKNASRTFRQEDRFKTGFVVR